MNNKRLVKIKTWEQMEQEFGLTPSGNINCKSTFIVDMEKQIPKNRIIILEDGCWGEWSISDDMIEEEITPEDYPQYFI